jgi:hypothetical protein
MYNLLAAIRGWRTASGHHSGVADRFWPPFGGGEPLLATIRGVANRFCGFRAGADLTGPGSPERTSSARMSGKTGEDPGSGETMAGCGHARGQVGDAGQGRGCDSVAPRRATLSHSCPIAPGRAVPREADGVMGTGDAGRGRAWRRPAHPDASWGRPEPAAYLCASTWAPGISPEPGISRNPDFPGKRPGARLPCTTARTGITSNRTDPGPDRPGPAPGRPRPGRVSRTAIPHQPAGRRRWTIAAFSKGGHPP